MNVISAQRHLQKALIAPLALGGLLLTAACGGDDGAEEAGDTTDGPATEETAEETADDDAGGDETDDADTATAEGAESSDETTEDEAFGIHEVEANDTADSCWAVMNDSVYDLTDWIDQHPGGEERIERLCGTDATEAFEDQHGGSDGPEAQLSEFEIGSLEG